ncbi:hypothetical protein [Sulfurimonas sp.]|uniref:hypothetical protein n=1 Tax=Sulfurimonas sp. TaxID=2022749 RepID=UPI002B463E4A|nr:hypothetical protein [Sulfurimonas sp.]
MGTLYDQEPRDYKRVEISRVNYFLDEVSELATKYKMERKDIIEAFKAVELARQNDLYVANGDIHDEQMAGIGQAVQEIGERLHQIADAIESKE